MIDVAGQRPVAPAIDNQLPVYPQPHAIIGVRIKSVASAARRRHLAGPTNGERIGLHGRGWRRRSPVGVDGGIGARHYWRGEIHVVEVLALKSGSKKSARFEIFKSMVGGAKK